MDDDERMELALNSNFDSDLFDCWDDNGDEEVNNNSGGGGGSLGHGGAKSTSGSMLQEEVPTSVDGRQRRGRRSANRRRDGDNDCGGGDDNDDDNGELLDRGDAGGETRGADESCWESPEAFEHFSRLPSFSLDNDYHDGRRTELILDDTNNVAASESSVEPSLLTNKAKREKSKGRTAPEAAGGALVGPPPPPSAVVSSYSSIASASASSTDGPGKSTLLLLSGDSSYAASDADADAPAVRPSASPSGQGLTAGGHDAASQMHPLGTLSSAKCPPHLLAPGAAAIPPDLQGAAFYPLALSALAAGAAANAMNMNSGQYLLDAVSNANNHAVAAAAVAAIIANPHHHHQHHLHAQRALNPSADPEPPANAAGGITTQQQPMPPSEASAGGAGGGTGSGGGGTPAAVSFDAAAAPIELRTNFENSLRAHGMLDANSVPFSFGVSVNGFHPQQGMMGSASSSVTGDASAGGMRLGAGMGGGGEKRLKNAKEQVRAQKIAELIDELREKMQKSGWSVGVSKSKFNTLSSCADYVKHLVKVTKEKEEAVKKARKDLEATRRKLDEDKSQMDPSDPESTTSSLTASSSSGTSTAAAGLAQGRKGRGGEFDGRDGGKKPKLSTHDSSISSSSGDDTDKNPSGVKVLDLDHATSSVSDLTDSLKGSHSHHHHKSEGMRSRTRHRPLPHASVEGGAGSEVTDADPEGGENVGHSARIPKRKLPLSEQSNSPGFELDYREAFVKSNVPQLIATTAGRIVAYNDFFLAITGMTSSDVDRATIFSFVKPSRLSNLFEMVAKSLRSAEPDETKASGTSQASSESSSKTWNYEAMTLPCTRFPATHAKQLYVTVTLMTDVDPRKRCFHCVLTDTPCTNGDIGRITPELLETLFASKNNTKKQKK